MLKQSITTISNNKTPNCHLKYLTDRVNKAVKIHLKR
jgi:hypothetical protein